MEDIVESTISTTLTTGARTYAIDAQITSNNLTIINNTISMDRGTAISIKRKILLTIQLLCMVHHML